MFHTHTSLGAQALHRLGISQILLTTGLLDPSRDLLVVETLSPSLVNWSWKKTESPRSGQLRWSLEFRSLLCLFQLVGMILNESVSAVTCLTNGKLRDGGEKTMTESWSSIMFKDSISKHLALPRTLRLGEILLILGCQ
nr:hypothetical protein Iba_chr15bCG2180 [Ipomoea batatas]